MGYRRQVYCKNLGSRLRSGLEFYGRDSVAPVGQMWRLKQTNGRTPTIGSVSMYRRISRHGSAHLELTTVVLDALCTTLNNTPRRTYSDSLKVTSPCSASVSCDWTLWRYINHALLGRIACIECKYAASCYRCNVVCVCVCVYVECVTKPRALQKRINRPR